MFWEKLIFWNRLNLIKNLTFIFFWKTGNIKLDRTKYVVALQYIKKLSLKNLSVSTNCTFDIRFSVNSLHKTKTFPGVVGYPPGASADGEYGSCFYLLSCMCWLVAIIRRVRGNTLPFSNFWKSCEGVYWRSECPQGIWSLIVLLWHQAKFLYIDLYQHTWGSTLTGLYPCGNNYRPGKRNDSSQVEILQKDQM